MRPSVFCFGFAFPRGLNLVFVQQSINLPPSNTAGISEGKDGQHSALVKVSSGEYMKNMSAWFTCSNEI